MEKDVPSHIVLNYIGVGLAASSTILYLFVKPETGGKVGNLDEDESRSESTMASSTDKSIKEIIEIGDRTDEGGGFLEHLSHRTKRFIGSALAIFSGVMYGQYNTPVLYAHQHYNKLIIISN